MHARTGLEGDTVRCGVKDGALLLKGSDEGVGRNSRECNQAGHQGGEEKEVDGDVVRTGTLDSDLYLNEQESVMNIHGKNGAGKCFVMAVQLFSDAALVSWSGGKPTMSRSAAGRLQFG